MITISACLIVKNEEEVLARCLDSLQGIYDELIIVDTGSTDATKEIAARYTEKVYDYEWINDFASARNYMFSKATMEYLYVADADEVLMPDQRENFLKLKQALLPEIEIVQMYYLDQSEYKTTDNFDLDLRPKLYRRLRKFTWIDPIHESVRLEPVVYDSEIVISHQPTSSHASRDFDVFQRIIRQGKDLSKKLQMMYARELYIAGEEKDFLTAETYFAGQLTQKNTKEELRLIYCVLIKCARIKNDLQQMFDYVTKILAAQLISSEMCYEIGQMYYEQQNYQDAFLWFYNAVYECESELNIHYQGDYSMNRAADCYHAFGNLEQEEYYREMAEKWKPKQRDN